MSQGLKQGLCINLERWDVGGGIGMGMEGGVQVGEGIGKPMTDSC